MMRKMSIQAAMMVGLLMLTGCGDSHEAVTKDGIAAMKKMVAALKEVKDKSTAESQKSTITAAAEELKKIQERKKALGDPDADKQKALETKYEKELNEVMGQLMGEVMRVGMLGAEVHGVLKDLETTMKDE